MRFAVLLVLIAACDQVYGLTGRDEGIPDAPSPFADGGDAPCELGNFDSSTVFRHPGFDDDQTEPALSADGLELFYSQPDSTNGLQLFRTTRPSLLVPFPPGSMLQDLNSAGDDGDPTITENGTTLLYTSTRLRGGNLHDVFQSRRSEAGGEWQSPTQVTLLQITNTYSIDVSADGTTLYVMDGDTTTSTLWEYKRPSVDQPFEESRQAGVGTRFPSVAPDEQSLYFQTNAGIQREERGPGGQFEAPTPVIANASDPDVSHDGATLSFHLDSGGLGYIKRACVAQ